MLSMYMLVQNFIKLSAAVHELTEKNLAMMLKTILRSFARAVTIILVWCLQCISDTIMAEKSYGGACVLPYDGKNFFSFKYTIIIFVICLL